MGIGKYIIFVALDIVDMTLVSIVPGQLYIYHFFVVLSIVSIIKKYYIKDMFKKLTL